MELSAVESPATTQRADLLRGEELIGESLSRVHDRVVREIEAMLLFVMSTGLSLEPKIARVVETSMCPPDRGPRPGLRLHAPDVDGVAAVAREGCTDTTRGGATDHFVNLSAAHQHLCKLVAPAQPGTLVLMMEDRRKHPWANRFGVLPIVRTMLALAVVSLCAMLVFALSDEVSVENMSKGLLSLKGSALLVNEAFIVSAAAVGATLANLKLLDGFVSTCTYDPRYDSSYWTRLVMGLISGVLLSQVIYATLAVQTKGASPDANMLRIFDQPVLALIGGFSAELVHNVLTHFINVIGNLFGVKRPPPQDVGRPLTAKAET
jgi:hypothetical protein